jgi:hypothetical protein
MAAPPKLFSRQKHHENFFILRARKKVNYFLLLTNQNYQNKSSKSTCFFYKTSYRVSHKNKAALFFAKVLLRGKEEAKNKNQLIDCITP